MLATVQHPTVSFSQIAIYCHELLKRGYKEATIQSHSRALRFLARNVNLQDTESVREFIASRPCTSGRKENLVNIYADYAKFHGISFDKPRYR